MNSLYTLITGEYKEGKTDLDRLITPAVLRIFRKKTKGEQRRFRYPELTPEQKKEIRRTFKEYERVDPLCHRVFTGRSGKFCPEYISEDMYYRRIEPYYSDRLTSKYLDNKCFYYRFFTGVRMPDLYCMRIGGYWVDEKFRRISSEKAEKIVEQKESSILKLATFSEGGHGVFFLEGKDRARTFRRLCRESDVDLVVQQVIRQHPAYAALHPESVNTYRIISLLTRDEGVKILASVIRIGTGGSRVDNLCSGGIFVGVGEGGQLGEIGAYDDGRVTREHPDLSYRFSDITLPYYDKAVELVRKSHGIMGHNRIAYWDVAVDESGEAVLIETNLALGTINCIQVCCGPLFGKDTKKILDEVYYDRNHRKKHRPWFGMNERNYYRLRDNLLGVLLGYYRSGYTQITLLGNAALRRIDRKLIAEVSGDYPKLTDRQKKEIREFYRPWRRKVQTESHRMYTAKSGRFCVDYIPEDLYMCDIDRFLSDREMTYDLDNKCYYYRLFPEAKQPAAVAMRIGGIWLDGEYQPISKRTVAELVLAEDEVVVKGAQGTEGGADVHFLTFNRPDGRLTKREKFGLLAGAVKSLRRDIVIQRPLKQHPELARLHPESVNTLRIISLLLDEDVVILSRMLKVGVGKKRVDNGCSGGIYCGIDQDGRLRGNGSRDNGKTAESHPDLGYSFKGIPVPCLEQCEELVKRCHPFMGHHRLISWDVAVDQDGDAVLIEANLALGASDDPQSLDGPFFGKYTKRILNETYGRKKRNGKRK